jgi:hypothetical protein
LKRSRPHRNASELSDASAATGIGSNVMVRIAISVEAFEAIATTLPVGSVGNENETNERGERTLWLLLTRPA